MLTEIDPFLPAVLVGEQPPDSGCGPRGALDGDSGRRLAKLAGVEPEVLYDATERYNLLSHAGDWAYHTADAQAAAEALAMRLPGRRVLMLGAQVSAAFVTALCRLMPERFTSIPRFSALRIAGLELVRLPHPDERDFKDPWVERATGKVVRAEVDRHRKARGSWVALTLPNAPELGVDARTIVYHPTSGRFSADKLATQGWRPTDEHVHDARFDGLDALQADGLLDLLVDAAGRVCRWGAGAPCYVGPHSLDVAGRTAQLATAMGWPSGQVAHAVRLAALHDLHECLPAVGDVPGPVCRVLRATSPAWRAIDDAARGAVAGLWAPTLADGGVTPEQCADCERLVLQADLDTRATERALFFGDAPAWLGPRGEALAEHVLESSGLHRGIPPEAVYSYDRGALRAAILFGELTTLSPSALLLPVV